MMFCTKYLDRKFEPQYICISIYIYIYIVLVEAGLPSSIKSTVPSVTV